MDLQVAIKGMLDARKELRSEAGVSDPFFISEQMQRLTQYTGAVEEHLALLEEQIEVDEQNSFMGMLNRPQSSEDKKPAITVNMAQTLAKQEVGSQKGEIAKLKRYINSSWQIVGVAQSRFNHLQKSTVGQI